MFSDENLCELIFLNGKFLICLWNAVSDIFEPCLEITRSPAVIQHELYWEILVGNLI